MFRTEAEPSVLSVHLGAMCNSQDEHLTRCLINAVQDAIRPTTSAMPSGQTTLKWFAHPAR